MTNLTIHIALISIVKHYQVWQIKLLSFRSYI